MHGCMEKNGYLSLHHSCCSRISGALLISLNKIIDKYTKNIKFLYLPSHPAYNIFRLEIYRNFWGSCEPILTSEERPGELEIYNCYLLDDFSLGVVSIFMS